MPLIGLGFVSAVVIASQCQDRIYKHLSKINGDKGQPEYRVCSGCSIKFSLTILYAAGTDSNRHVYHANRIIYFCKCNAFSFFYALITVLKGWTAHAEVHWMGPFVGQAVMGIGLMLAFNTIQNLLSGRNVCFDLTDTCPQLRRCFLPLFCCSRSRGNCRKYDPPRWAPSLLTNGLFLGGARLVRLWLVSCPFLRPLCL